LSRNSAFKLGGLAQPGQAAVEALAEQFDLPADFVEALGAREN
jgi:hypothetical protein